MPENKLYLSNLVKNSKMIDKKIEFINEQPFKYFARATSELAEAKCLFVGSIKFAKNIDDYTRMIITTREVYEELRDYKCGFCIVKRPRDIFFQLMEEYELNLTSVLPKTVIGKDCNISPLASVAKNGVIIGDRVTIEDFVRIEPNTVIGDDCIVCSGAKIGVQGFNLYDYEGVRRRLFHGGKTIIGKNVLVSCNTLVEQALYWYMTTEIGDNSKIGGNAIIGHNAQIGKDCDITSGSIIAGFVTVGDKTVVRIGVSTANGLHIGSNAHVGIGAVVVRNVRDNANMFGNPAKDLNRC